MSESDSVAVAVAEILTHVKGLDRCRITYFLEHPSSASASSQEEFARDIRERANTLIQEVPVRIQRTSSQYHYLEGRIRNACVDYDPKAEELLDKCIRADSKHVEAWLELGACAWKKPDLSKALTCFQHAVDQLRRGERPMDAKLTAKALCLLSAALRAQLSSLRGGRRERVEKLQEALKLCQDALKLRAGYAFGQYSLGNTLLARFFLVGQLQESDLTKALEAYSSAISPRPAPTQPFINADLHVNYGVALQYCQRYTSALEQFHRALAIEPNFTVAKERLHSLQSYLTTVNEWVAKPKIQQRRWRDISKELRSEKTRKWATAHDPLLRVAGADEMEGAGEIFAGERTEAQGMAILVAVLGQVSPVDEVPKTLIATDASSHPIVLAIYNFSPKFSALIGDQFLIPKPSLIRVKVDSTLLSSVGERQEVGGVEFPLIRVTDPCRMVKNGKQLHASMRAMTDLSISAEAN